MCKVRSINELPPEILTIIFRYLDQRSLGKATVICKYWKEVIEEACRWKICIDCRYLKTYGPQMNQFFFTTSRKFSKIAIIGLGDTNVDIRIFRRHGRNVSKLTFSRTILQDLDYFIETIKCMPNLRQVKLFNVGIHDVASSSTDGQQSLPEFVKLKTLEANCANDLIRCFKRSPNLSEFVLWDFSKDTTVVEFNQSQKQLKSLVLYEIDNSSALLQPGVITNDSVSQLYLNYDRLDKSQQSWNNLLGFLKMHAKSVEILRLGFGTPKSVYEFVFSKFENLKSLQLPIYEIAREKELLKQLKVNKSITQLFLIGLSSKKEQMGSQCVKEFIRCVPNVTDLTLQHCYSKEFLEILAQNLVNLRRIIFYGNFKSEYSDIRFSNLKTLRSVDVEFNFDWEKFTKLNPHITELVVTGFNKDFAVEAFETLRKNLKLQIFKISYDKYKYLHMPDDLMSGVPYWFINDSR
ncbi:hypothetical protein Bhyg_16206, partial [Pseudolycoriella hygida]